MRIDSFIETKANQPSTLIAGDGFFGVVDNLSNIHFVKDMSVVSLQKFASPAPHPYYKGNRASQTGKFLVLWIESKKTHFIFTYEPAKRGYSILVELEWDSSMPATSASFSPDETLLALANELGEVAIFHIATGKMVLDLPKCADHITIVQFDKNGTKLFYTSCQNDINIYDLNQNALIYRGSQPHEITGARFINSEEKIVLSTSIGTIIVFDYKNRQFDPFPKKLNREIRSLYLDENEEFVLIADQDGKLYIAGLNEKEKDLEFLGDLEASVVSIDIKNGEISALLSTGSIAQFEHSKYMKFLEKLVKEKDIKAIITLGKNYPPCRYTQTYKTLDKFFEEAYKKAQNLVGKKEMQKAKELLDQFADEPRYQMQIGSFVLNAPKIRAFSDVVSQDRLEQAYAMTNTSDLYKSLELYKNLEIRFGLQLRAAVLMLTGTKTDVIAARRAVENYAKVASKTKILQSVFDMPLLFKTASDMIRDNELEAFKMLAKKYPILNKTPCYLRYEDSAKKAINDFEKLYQNSNFQEAIIKAEEIAKCYTAFADQIEEKLQIAKISRAFEEAMENKNYQSALAYTLRNSFLTNHKYYHQLIFHYNYIFSSAINFAFMLRFDELNSMLLSMLRIKIFKERVISIYYLYYLRELDGLSNQLSADQYAKVLLWIVESFGLSKMLLNITKKAKKDHLLNSVANKSAKEFVNRPIIPSLKTLI